MGRKILVAQIGKLRLSVAEELDYAYFSDSKKDGGGKYIKDMSEKACYPFFAYLKTMGSDVFTDLMLIGTRESTWEAFLENRSRETLGCETDKIREKLADELKQKYNVNTVTVIIKNGVTETEIMENFNDIKEQLEYMIEPEKTNDACSKEISIYLDISNAFRSVPMLVFAATNYLSVLHNDFKFNLDVYCSVGESKINSVIPMVNITAVSVINQWRMAINEFYDSGSVVNLTRLIQNGKDEWFADCVTENGRNEKDTQKNAVHRKS